MLNYSDSRIYLSQNLPYGSKAIQDLLASLNPELRVWSAEVYSFDRIPEVVKTHEDLKAKLKALPGMTLVELTNEKAVRMMKTFARTYPWDWNADIGLIPPSDENRLVHDVALRTSLAATHRPDTGMVAKAVVVDCEGTVLESAKDGRADHGGNPCMGAPIMARPSSAVSVLLQKYSIRLPSGSKK